MLRADTREAEEDSPAIASFMPFIQKGQQARKPNDFSNPVLNQAKTMAATEGQCAICLVPYSHMGKGAQHSLLRA